jgi:hypothetical protein
MADYFKVVRETRLHHFRSVTHTTACKYGHQKKTIAPKDTKLFVFDDYAQAYDFALHNATIPNCILWIFRCDVEDPIEPTTNEIPIAWHGSRFMRAKDKFWMNMNTNRSARYEFSETNLRPIPLATIWVTSVILKEPLQVIDYVRPTRSPADYDLARVGIVDTMDTMDKTLS